MEKQKVKVLTTENLAPNVAKVVTDNKSILLLHGEVMKGDYKYYVLKSSNEVIIRVPQSDCEIKTSVKSKNKKK